MLPSFLSQPYGDLVPGIDGNHWISHIPRLLQPRADQFCRRLSPVGQLDQARTPPAGLWSLPWSRCMPHAGKGPLRAHTELTHILSCPSFSLAILHSEHRIALAIVCPSRPSASHHRTARLQSSVGPRQITWRRPLSSYTHRLWTCKPSRPLKGSRDAHQLLAGLPVGVGAELLMKRLGEFFYLAQRFPRASLPLKHATQ